ncbi:MAG TPA: acetate kinase [Armatimonadota bacterium]|jgi:acetate kinase
MHVLVINGGSSTVKARLIETDSGAMLGKGLVDRIGTPEGSFEWESNGEKTARAMPNGTVGEGVDGMIHLASAVQEIQAVGHRIVHGGELFTRPTLIDDEVLKGIEYCTLFAPLHNPAHAAGIKAARAALPNVPHVAVFDTAFHATMPPWAHRYAIEETYYRNHGVRRYGAHGTSHQYLSGEANKWLAAHGVQTPHRVCTLHLGNGSSMAAVLNGVCQDTSMGFTPLEGLVMGSRCGDMDPAVVPFLMARLGWDPAKADHWLNKESGLLGVSAVSADMRDIERGRAEGHPGCTLAFDLFCYRIVKYIGAYAAVLGGLDAIVFSGGIGEHSHGVRAEVVKGAAWLGVSLNESANADPNGACTVISNAGEKPVALVIPTDEEGLIARQTAELAAAA